MIIEKLKKNLIILLLLILSLDKTEETKGKSPIQYVRSIKISSQEKHLRLWSSLKVIPFDPKKSLFICYNAVAEAIA